jgi:uncharacterized protein (DUF934 family)
MPRLLRLEADGRPAFVEDHRVWIEDADVGADALPDGPVLVPLALWQAETEALRARGDVGVWLAPDEDCEALAADAATLPVIGIHFPTFTDGRGLSTAALLRTRFGFRGELRALGDVQRDQLAPMRRCGIDAFRMRPDLDAEHAAPGLEVMTHHYQGDALDPRPLFRRVHRPRSLTDGLAADAA